MLTLQHEFEVFSLSWLPARDFLIVGGSSIVIWEFRKDLVEEYKEQVCILKASIVYIKLTIDIGQKRCNLLCESINHISREWVPTVFQLTQRYHKLPNNIKQQSVSLQGR